MLKNLEIKGIIFDMDGVITNTMPDHYKAWNEVTKGDPIHVSHFEVYSHEGQPGMEFLEDIFSYRNIPFDCKKAQRILDKKEKMFKKIVKTRFIAGARSFLKRLKKRKFKLALVTGTALHELHKILPDELHDLFDIVVTGNDVTKGKPHPEPFLKGLQKLGMKPQDVIVIENAPFGIQSAQSAGLRCFALETSLPRKYLKDAEAVFASFKELERTLGLTSIEVES